MRKAVIILLCLFCLAHTGRAKDAPTYNNTGTEDSTQTTAGDLQKHRYISIALDGWLIHNSAAFAMKDYVDNPKGYTSFYCGINAAWNAKLYEIGLGVHYGKTGAGYKSLYPFPAASPGITYGFKWRTGFLAPCVYANYKFNGKQSYLYAGVNIGCLIFLDAATLSYDYRPGGSFPGMIKPAILASNQEKALRLGLQTGYNMALARHWSFRVETGIYYIPLKKAYLDVDFNSNLQGYSRRTAFVQVPLTLGMAYLFNGR